MFASQGRLAVAACAVVLVDVVAGLAFGGAEVTAFGAVHEYYRAAIQPTPAPYWGVQLMERQFNDPPNLCGYTDGDFDRPDYCPSSSTCFPQQEGGLACCAGSCSPYVAPTSCVEQNDVTGTSYVQQLTDMITTCTANARCNDKTYFIAGSTYIAAYCVTTEPDNAQIFESTTGGFTTSSPPESSFTTSSEPPTTSSETPFTDTSSTGTSSTTSDTTTSSPVTSSTTTSSTTTSSTGTDLTPGGFVPATSSAPGPSSPTATPDSGSSTNIGAIVGGVVGGVAVLAILALLGFLVYRHKSRRRNETTSSGYAGPVDGHAPGGAAAAELKGDRELYVTSTPKGTEGYSELSADQAAGTTSFNGSGKTAASPPPQFSVLEKDGVAPYMGSEMSGSTGYTNPEYPAGVHEAMSRSDAQSAHYNPNSGYGVI